MSLAAIETTQRNAILIVDDDKRICTTLQLLLEAEGYDCHYVTSIEEAHQSLGYQPYDLVITDMYLQEGRSVGLELIDHVIRTDDTIPVIMITGFPTIGHAVDAMRRGALDFITKPFDRDMLLHQVRKALQERRLRQENHRLQAEVNQTAVIEKLNRQLDRRINELTRLYAISEGLNDFLDSPALFDRIASLAAEVTGAQRVSVMVFDRDRHFLKIRAAIGVPSQVVNGTVMRLGEGIAGEVARTRKPIRITQRLNATDTQMRRSGVYKSHSWLSLPLLIGGEVFGVLNLTDKLDRSDFTREDEQIMMTLVEKAGIKLENQALYEGIYSNLLDTLNSLVTTIEAKDSYTRQHSQRVTEYAVGLARFIELSDEQIEMLNFAGMLHDIGKIGVRDGILTKSGSLTGEEYDLIKQHPLIGERIVAPLGLVSEELSIIRHHHERWDGSGYPDGLAGEQISLLARVLGVVDAFDAMTTTRSYRNAMSVEDTLREMHRYAGSQFDPHLVDAWSEALRKHAIVLPTTLAVGNA